MSIYSPKQILEIVKNVAEEKASTSTAKTLVLAFVAGSYIALGGLFALIVGGGIPGIAEVNPGIQRLLMGAAFPIGLMFCAILGADLFTGNTAYFIPPVMSKRLGLADLLKNWTLVYFGNFIGALFVAYFMASATGILAESPWLESLDTLAYSKINQSFYQVLLKGIGANWLVALAMWMAYSAKSTTGKIIGIWFPVMAFVAIGFEHSIANMFFVPAAIFNGIDISWADFIFNNLIPATIGNIIGGGVLVGLIYWYIFED